MSSEYIYWAVGMTTAPREQPTIAESIRSVVAAGWPEVFVMAEPNSPRPEADNAVKWLWHSQIAGPWKNFRLLLKFLVEQNPWAPAILMLQDDVRLTTGLRELLNRSRIMRYILDQGPDSRFGVASLYCSADNERSLHNDHEGWLYYPQERMPAMPQGALAYVFSRESAEELVKSPPSPEQNACIERHVALWCKINGRRYWTHSPSFCLHTGEGLSTLRTDDPALVKCRQAGSFIESVKTDCWMSPNA
jgi:hypothetical protein